MKTMEIVPSKDKNDSGRKYMKEGIQGQEKVQCMIQAVKTTVDITPSYSM